MNIVVFDGYTLNPGDLNWNDLNALGKAVVFDRTPPELVEERAKGANVLLTFFLDIMYDL
jgi:glycerate dehydrogenase